MANTGRGLLKSGDINHKGDLGGPSATAVVSGNEITGKGDTMRKYDGLDTVTIATTGGAEGFDDYSSKKPTISGH